jgi:hexosaminidase
MSEITIIPQPVQLQSQEGVFTLSADTHLAASAETAAIAQLLQHWLTPATGLELPILSETTNRPSEIRFLIDPAQTRFGPEGYTLNITPQYIEARAMRPNGLFYAVQTLRQLLPPAIFTRNRSEGPWTIPCLQMVDFPRFAWRGAMLDTGRHFMPKEFIFKFIDLLALHKLNVFHWHLTEDQGWRIEIKRYPRLTEVGAWRKQTIIGHADENTKSPKYDGKPHGGFYTQEDIRQVVAFARSRFITVIPEIEMPGHAQAAISAYPELGCTDTPLEVSSIWGISENIYNLNESTFTFLENVLDEVLSLFPSKFIHIGGDEVPKKQWKNNPFIQSQMQALGLKDEEELQSYFIRRIEQFLDSRGRRLIGWDEILEGGLAPHASVMSWRGEEGGVAAAMANHDVIMAPWQFTYLDHYQSQDRSREPLAIGGFLPLQKVYEYEPVCAGIDASHAHHVLGAQAQLWTEYMPTPAQVEYMAFPRLCAFSETVWTPQNRKNLAAFNQRLITHLIRLERLGINYRRGRVL